MMITVLTVKKKHNVLSDQALLLARAFDCQTKVLSRKHVLVNIFGQKIFVSFHRHEQSCARVFYFLITQACLLQVEKYWVMSLFLFTFSPHVLFCCFFSAGYECDARLRG